MTDLNQLYQDLTEDDHADHQIRLMLEEGKHRRAKISIMEFAKARGIYLGNLEALHVLDHFMETNLTLEEQTRARFPKRDINLGMRRGESIADPSHRLPPNG